MRTVRYLAAAATALMALMNLPIAFDDGGAGIPAPLAWLITVLGVAGLGASIALLARVPWGVPAVIAIGALNLIGSIVALALGGDGAIIGLIVSALGLGLGIASGRRPARPGLTTA
jgi:hypothetical protein